MKLVDTSVAVDHLRGDESATTLLTAMLEDDGLAASEVTRFELLGGVRDDELEALEQFFDAIDWIPVDELVARTAGALARRYRSGHSGIDDADYLIAASAVVVAADLLTTTVRHFPMFVGLQPAY